MSLSFDRARVEQRIAENFGCRVHEVWCMDEFKACLAEIDRMGKMLDLQGEVVQALTDALSKAKKEIDRLSMTPMENADAAR